MESLYNLTELISAKSSSNEMTRKRDSDTSVTPTRPTPDRQHSKQNIKLLQMAENWSYLSRSGGSGVGLAVKHQSNQRQAKDRRKNTLNQMAQNCSILGFGFDAV